ncbi:hypothetical protein BKI52_13780 [marine bacterium AO1-C]|nr:hypothetical protein BKI52_13780 [marine bacterium AO1-C]
MSQRKKKIRSRFREEVFKRDGYKCVFCDEVHQLDAHHITDRTEMPNGGYVKENGITLCADHHMMAEQFHISGGTKWVARMHPEDLYYKIGSSKKLALQQSQLLEQKL